MSGGRFSVGTWVRRLVQLSFLALFVVSVVAAFHRPNLVPSAWHKAFFLIDPLILATTWLTAHSVPAAAWWALVTVGLTLLLGRVFCGWACPLGTLQDIAARFFRWCWPDRKARDHWTPWQRTKYYLLAGFLAGAVFGLHWVTIFDPLVLLYRTMAVAVMPAAQWSIDTSSKAIYDADPHVGSFPLTDISEPPSRLLREKVFGLTPMAYLGGAGVLAVFLALMVATRWRRRFWCRYLCPLGALLGLLSWRPLLRRVTRSESCNHCDLCSSNCHGGAAGPGGEAWRSTECLGCLNCSAQCRSRSLRFTPVLPWRREPRLEPIDLGRRATMAAAAGGLATLCLMRSGPQSRGLTYHPFLLRPPGALPERDFLERCTGCGLCINVCPTGGLQLAVTEAGLEGLWTPRLVPLIGYCDYDCTACGHACPTGAIQPLTLEEKHQFRIGLASFDTTRCIPYAYGRDCIVCEEHCPIPDKAIYTVEVEIVQRDGQKRTIKQPHVDPDKCIGCGVCEHVCPFEDQAGVRVRSGNETRHESGERPNRPLPPGGDGAGIYF